jgi:hypothetical protein
MVPYAHKRMTVNENLRILNCSVAPRGRNAHRHTEYGRRLPPDAHVVGNDRSLTRGTQYSPPVQPTFSRLAIVALALTILTFPPASPVCPPPSGCNSTLFRRQRHIPADTTKTHDRDTPRRPRSPRRNYDPALSRNPEMPKSTETIFRMRRDFRS